MARLRHSIEVMLAAALIATIAAHGRSNAQALFSEEWEEKWAKEQFRERLKHVYLNDGQEVDCPTFTGLIYSAGDTFTLIIPQYIGLGMSGFIGKNLPYFTFEKQNCHYTVTVKRFDRSNGIETEVPPKKRDVKTELDETVKKILERRKNKQEERKQPLVPPDVQPMDPVQAMPLYNVPARRGRDSLIDRNSVEFDSPTRTMKFTGIMYFAPRSFSVHLVDVDEDLDIESRKDHETKQYEVSSLIRRRA